MSIVVGAASMTRLTVGWLLLAAGGSTIAADAADIH
jgi:hypothetical protein